MKTTWGNQRIQKHRMKFIDSFIGSQGTPVRVFTLARIPLSGEEHSLLGTGKRGKVPDVRSRLCSMRNQDVEHYLERKSISVTLVLGVHAPIPSVC